MRVRRASLAAVRVVPWLLLPVFAAAATLQVNKRFAPEHEQQLESEVVKRIGPEEIVASGPGWEARRYPTKGGLMCLDTWFGEGGMSGGCFDLRLKRLQWGRARYEGIYIVSGWAPPACHEVILDRPVTRPHDVGLDSLVILTDSEGWFVKQVEHPISAARCGGT
jgi:hypothetical protein